jgi:fido (protein-threonine AMPylation protein)
LIRAPVLKLLAKGGSLFCLVPHIAGQMAQRFAAIRAENGLRGLPREAFAARAAEHLCEINAIHPFREGNGRTLRVFLVCLAEAAGHHAALERGLDRQLPARRLRGYASGHPGYLD